MNDTLYLLIPIVVLLILIVWWALSSPCGWRAWMLYQITRVYCPLVFRWKATNASTIPEHSSAIIIANHTSPVDPMVLWMGHLRSFRRPRMRVIEFMTAKEYCEQRNIVGWICRALDAIPVTRSGRDMGPAREALRRLKDSRLLGVFPEGRINAETPDQQLLPGEVGTAWLALKSGVPVIPIYVHGAPRAKTMVRCFITPTRTTLTYGDPIDLSAWTGSRLTQETLREVSDLMMTRLAELGGINPPRRTKSKRMATEKPKSVARQSDTGRQG